MATQATYDDANLILRLYEIRREEKMRAAREWFAKNFRPKSFAELNQLCPAGSQENAYYRMVVTYYEMAASFITSGVLSSELFFQSGLELMLVWERIRPILPELRETFKHPGLYKNLEAVSKLYVQYLDRQGPDAYQAFAARVGG
ncbi:MAG: hypothetical protein ACK5AZ_19205 [Bryobacteraceae bacterium]